eukprot:509350-Rhodomonas_salina.2
MSETVDSNFVAEYNNNLTAMGLLKAGKDHLHIEEVNCRMVLQLETAQKAFTMVKDLCEHLCICSLTLIVKDLAHRDITEVNAWRMADNHLLAYKATTSTSVLPMTNCTFNTVTAITIAQKHIEQMPNEVITPSAAMVIKMGATKSVLKVGSKLARTGQRPESCKY